MVGVGGVALASHYKATSSLLPGSVQQLVSPVATELPLKSGYQLVAPWPASTPNSATLAWEGGPSNPTDAGIYAPPNQKPSSIGCSLGWGTGDSNAGISTPVYEPEIPATLSPVAADQQYLMSGAWNGGSITGYQFHKISSLVLRSTTGSAHYSLATWQSKVGYNITDVSVIVAPTYDAVSQEATGAYIGFYIAARCNSIDGSSPVPAGDIGSLNKMAATFTVGPAPDTEPSGP